jgi:hypothetical protein
MKLTYGDSAAREVSGRIAGPPATTTELKATPADRRVDGQLFLVIADGSLWFYSATSSASAGATVLVPDVGTGRFLACTLATSG